MDKIEQQLKDAIQETEKALKSYIEERDKTGRWKPEYDERYYTIDRKGYTLCATWSNHIADDWRYLQGYCFKTREQAEKHLTYLKAKAVIIEDAGGYEFERGGFNWYGSYDYECKELCETNTLHFKEDVIYFKSKEAIMKSQIEHPQEWLDYLGVEA